MPIFAEQGRSTSAVIMVGDVFCCTEFDRDYVLLGIQVMMPCTEIMRVCSGKTVQVITNC